MFGRGAYSPAVLFLVPSCQDARSPGLVVILSPSVYPQSSYFCGASIHAADSEILNVLTVPPKSEMPDRDPDRSVQFDECRSGVF
jgi:hypothetical protein